jgi:hypothetical protein
VKTDGQVIKNDSLFGLYFLEQGLLIAENGQQGDKSHSAILFSRIARQGKTYEFIIAPKSGLVLDFEEISSNTN